MICQSICCIQPANSANNLLPFGDSLQSPCITSRFHIAHDNLNYDITHKYKGITNNILFTSVDYY